MRLYHYTSLENFWKIWVTKELLFASSNVPSNNDYFERKKSFHINGNEGDIFINDVLVNSSKRRIPNVFYQLNRYKQISFTMDYSKEKYGFESLGCLSPMMWGQYADRGSGVCIELDSDALDIKSDVIWAKDIDYVDKQNSFSITTEDQESIETINDAISKQRDIVFFQKSVHWKAENEYRLVSKDVRKLKIEYAVRKIIVPGIEGKTTNLVKRLVERQDLLYFLQTNEENGTKELSIAPFPISSK